LKGIKLEGNPKGSEAIAVINSGETLGNIQQTLIKKGVFLACGTRPSVGTGQFVSGGIGFATRAFGMTIEDVVAMDVVLATSDVSTSGKITKISEQSERKLFWAMRGNGSNNYCAVIRYYIKTHPCPPKVLVFTFNYDLDTNVVEWLTSEKRRKMNPNLTCQLVISKTGIKFEGQQLNDDKVQLWRSLKDLPRPKSSEIKTVSMMEAFQYFSAPTVREYVDGKSSFGMKELELMAIERLFEAVQRIEGRFTIGIQQLKGKSVAKTSFIAPKSPFWINYTLRWTEERPDGDFEKIEILYSEMKKYLSPFAYQGYSDSRLKDPEFAYYGKLLPKLREIKTKYDPEDIFTHSNGIKPL
jgi:FAD/FMN-containing dehydrogenase